jgi:hypothetical protein
MEKITGSIKYRNLLEKLEEKFRQGEISETIYLKLKAEYQERMKKGDHD